MKRFSHKQWVWLGFIFLFIFMGIQFVRPTLENPSVTSVIQLPDSAQQLLVKSCFDCHTSMTKYSWFDRIAPASWVVSDHVREGRKLVNFSQWDSLSGDQQKVVLFESLNQMQFQTMPLGQYTFIHPSAKVSQQDIHVFQSYLSRLVSPYSPDTAKANKWKDQYALWMKGTPDAQKVKPSLNGIVFDPDYKNWVAISSTERFDNGTMRVIVGNEIAVDAVRSHHTNPWPNGTVLVKILWISKVDSSGNLQSGAFRQADFMIRDQKKYADTEGWGFARWASGLQLIPYGKNELFASECVNCHRSMRSNDFVFTEPINLNEDVDMHRKVIMSSIDRNKSTMSTLYGNDRAVHFARTSTGNQYPFGSELTLVTWKQKEDDHWYGARIPGSIQKVEKIHISDSGKLGLYPVYEKKGGASAGPIANSGTMDAKARMSYILNLRPSVMP
jgi:Haem-binding domain/Cytochrome P460